MLSKISIRVRLTMMSVALLTLCCVGLTLLLNTSANRIVATIDALLSTPEEKNQGDQNGSVSAAKTTNYDIENSPLATAARADYRMESIIYMLLMIIGGGVLTYYVSGRALKPLKTLNDQVKNIHAHNLSESLAVPTTRDEIAELTKSFNEMTNKLDRAFRLQQQFSASAAHELKTPLAVLQTKVDVFRLQNSHNTAEYEALVSVFEKQIYRLRGLVTNLLEMTQTDYENEKSTICVNDILTDIFEELRMVADEKNVTLSLQCDNSMIYGNLDSLYRAFYNLVENAIKYNVDGGSVTVTVCKNNPNGVSVQVSDTGISIPDDCKKEVFEPFFRVDKSRNREMGGAGLGLALVRCIVEQHSGEISVNDNKPCGTVFNIVFPKC